MLFDDIVALVINIILEFIAGGIVFGGALIVIIGISGMLFSELLTKLKIKNSGFLPPLSVVWTCYIIGGLFGAIRCAIRFFN